MRIAYLTGRYPAVSHTFVMREIHALRRLGVEIHTFSIWRTAEAELLSEQDRAEHASTMALLPPRLLTYARAHLGVLVRSPGAYGRAVRRAVGLRAPGRRGLMLAVSWWLESLALWQACRERSIRHIHVHLNGTAPAVALLTARLAAELDPAHGLSWSMTVHGPAEFYDVPGERLAEKLREASFVVCISDFARSQAMVWLEERDWGKLAVVHCGVGSPSASVPDETSRDPASVLSIGRLAPAKGHALLIDAIAELARRGVGASLTLVGDGPRRTALEQRVRECGAGERVELVGAVGADRIGAYYERADIFCLSSLAEGVPVVLMEAMAAGLPVVAPRLMGVMELVEDEVSGLLVAPGRVDQIADALERLLGDPALRRRLGDAAREKVHAEFDITRSARQLHDLFATCISDG